jgi:predicted ATPase
MPDRSGRINMSRWPATVPAVTQILAKGLELPAGVTVLVGENGSGKSTVIEIFVATHSPMVAAVPGARLLELGEWGIRQASWEDLELVALWREHLCRPGSYLRHLVSRS